VNTNNDFSLSFFGRFFEKKTYINLKESFGGGFTSSHER